MKSALKMNKYEAGQIVYSRIQSLEPENASKITGYLLLELVDEEMIRLAFSPYMLLQSMISKTKEQLGLSSSIQQMLSDHNSPFHYSHLIPPRPNGFHPTLLSSQDLMHPSNFHDNNNDYLNLSRHQSLPHDLKFNDSQDQLYYSDSYTTLSNEPVYPEIPAFFKGTMKHRRSHSMTDAVSASSELSVSSKPCMYFARGYCKHGSNCRFSHSLSGPRDFCIEKISLEKLEMEMQELLRGIRSPVSIASLPQLYYERFGKILQAEGYLAESQRHGKNGYSLTNLLARLKNTVTLIDRPHGQHAVILAEDSYRFRPYRSSSEREDLGSVNHGSRQIYMTFPAESTFTEEDVSKYFGNFGPVEDVRIPYQQKRMFGFVTYVYPHTVKVILAKGNPHYVCGSRVLVKPYKEKSKHGDRKHGDKGEHSKYLSSQNLDPKEYDSRIGSRLFESSDVMRRQMEEQEQGFELECLHFADMHLSDVKSRQVRSQLSMALAQQNHFSNGQINPKEETKASEDLNGPDPSLDQFSYVLDVLESEQNSEVEQKHKIDSDDECNNEHNLPDSPFSVSNGLITLPNPEKSRLLSVFNNARQEPSTSDFTQISLWSRCS